LQGRLSSADKKLLWGAALLGVALVGASAVLAPAEQGGDSPVPSSYSADPDGALAAYTLLSELRFPVRRWQQSPSQLDANPSESVLILAEPSATTSAGERRALLEFVAKGGRVLFCGPMLEAFFPLPGTRPAFSLAPLPVQAELPTAYTRGAESIEMRARAKWDSKDSKGLRLYGPDADPAVVLATLGQGEVLWWAAATPLSNVGISQAGNLRLFLNAMANADRTPRVVYWDEYFHGEQGDLCPGALLFAFSRRSGPIVVPFTRSRLSPLEFVDTMGELYSRAGAASIAVEVPYRKLRLDLARRVGRAHGSSDAELARAAAQRLGLAEAEVYRVLRAADDASGAVKLAPKQALVLVQTLVRYAQELKKPTSFQEKKN
jgi:hypothetical protein